MDYPNRLELVPKPEDSPAYLEECARLLSAYVSMLHLSGITVEDKTPAQEGAQEIIADKFKSQPSLNKMLELAERILGKSVPADTLEEIKARALQKLPEKN